MVDISFELIIALVAIAAVLYVIVRLTRTPRDAKIPVIGHWFRKKEEYWNKDRRTFGRVRDVRPSGNKGRVDVYYSTGSLNPLAAKVDYNLDQNCFTTLKNLESGEEILFYSTQLDQLDEAAVLAVIKENKSLRSKVDFLMRLVQENKDTVRGKFSESTAKERLASYAQFTEQSRGGFRAPQERTVIQTQTKEEKKPTPEVPTTPSKPPT